MIFLPFASLHLEELPMTEEGITLLASRTTEIELCPDCQTPSPRVHSCYQRTLKDLPSSGLPVQLKLQVRRFFCDNPSCSRKTFAEKAPDLALRYARKTVRLRFCQNSEDDLAERRLIVYACEKPTSDRMRSE